MNKVIIIGCGNVGMSYAFSLLNQNTNVNELVLIDINKDRIIGEAMDLNHCLAFSPSKIDIRVGDYTDCRDAKLIVIAAGANQNPGETRMDLINKNSKIFKSIITEVMKNNFKGYFLVATNPLDIMTYITYKYSGMKPNKVIGSGTSLDTARLRYIVGEKVGINPKSIHTYVIGEHGDSEFVLWSSALIGSEKIDKYLTQDEMIKIEDDVRNAAYEIIDRKGATYYGIAMCLTRITTAILNNENTIITVSSYDEENDIYFSTPSVINKDGATKKMKIELNNEEQEKLENSINVIKDAIKRIEE
mgnify:FL=1